jgi:hypothetical protein
MKISKLEETPYFFSVTVHEKVYMLASRTEQERSAWLRFIKDLVVSVNSLSASVAKLQLAMVLIERQRAKNKRMGLNRLFGMKYKHIYRSLESFDWPNTLFQNDNSYPHESINRFTNAKHKLLPVRILVHMSLVDLTVTVVTESADGSEAG